MSGLLGSILSMAGSQGQSQQAGIASLLQQALSPNGGGVDALVSRFKGAGLGEQAQSWVNPGANQSISPEHVGQVFTSEELETWAGQTGIPVDKVKELLAEALPHAVDHVTPEGQVPAANVTPDLTSLVGRFFGA
jgi:uncharacterized protein YidB (DUF937 family)